MPLSWLPLIADYTRFGSSAGGTFRARCSLWNREHLVLCARCVLRTGSGGGDALLTVALAQAAGGIALLLILIDEVDTLSRYPFRRRFHRHVLGKGERAAAVGGVRRAAAR